MQKYIKNDLSEVIYLDDDINAEDWININDYRLMTSEEVRMHETIPASQFHTQWDGENWIDVRTKEEVDNYNRAVLPDITQKQLRLTLIQNGIMPDMVEAQIASIPDDDKHTRLIAQAEWQYAQSFERMSENLNMIAKDLLGMDDLQIDTMWQQAMQI